MESILLQLPEFSHQDSLKLFQDNFNLPEKYQYLLEDDAFAHWHSSVCSYESVLPLSECKQYIEQRGRHTIIHNFVYDRHMGVVFVNLEIGDHDAFMSALCNLHRLSRGDEAPKSSNIHKYSLHQIFHETGDAYDSQEDFLRLAMGFYQSSTSNRLYRHENFIMNAQERMVFGIMPVYTYAW